MAPQLTPPTKAMFRISVVLALVAIAFYFLGVFGVSPPDYQPAMVHFAFWIGALAWLAMFTGLASKGI
jgi:hypothetical protein